MRYGIIKISDEMRAEILRRRLAANLPRRILCKLAGISHHCLFDIERGTYPSVSVKVHAKILETLAQIEQEDHDEHGD